MKASVNHRTTWPGKDPARTRWVVVALLFAIVLTVSPLTIPGTTSITAQATGAGSGLRVVDTLPYSDLFDKSNRQWVGPASAVGSGRDTREDSNLKPPMMVADTSRNLGFALGRWQNAVGDSNNSTWRFAMYDLDKLELVDWFAPTNTAPLPSARRYPSYISNWPVDEERGRIIAMAFTEPISQDTVACPETSAGSGRFTQRGREIRYLNADEEPEFGPTMADNVITTDMPCPDRVPYINLGGKFYDDPVTGRRKLYVVAVPLTEYSARSLTRVFYGININDNDGQPLIVRQIDVERMVEGGKESAATAVDWQIDLRTVGCGRLPLAFVDRTRDALITYCADTSAAHTGISPNGTGYVVKIPLHTEDDPATLGEDERSTPRTVGPPQRDPSLPQSRSYLNAAGVRIPALPGSVRPFVDPVSERVLLLTNDSVNGNAVWVLDQEQERFIGNITPGEARRPTTCDKVDFDIPLQRRRWNRDKSGSTFDPVRGRAYVFSDQGFLVGSTRQEQLAGSMHRLLNGCERLSTPNLIVLPHLERIIVPIEGIGYVALEDTIPDPPEPLPNEPDKYTTQVPEQPGRTYANALGAGQASGVHVMVAGGIPRSVEGNDPFCTEVRLSNPDDPDASTALQDPQQHIDPYREPEAFNGKCVWEHLVDPGTRDFLVAATEVNAGNNTGVSGRAQALATTNNDQALDRDLREASDCKREDTWALSENSVVFGMQPLTQPIPLSSAVWDAVNNGLAPLREGIKQLRDGDEENPGLRDAFYEIFRDQELESDDPDAGLDDGGPYRQLCHGPQDGIREGDGGRTPDLSKGTEGRDGAGYPTPAAECSETTGDARRSVSFDALETPAAESQAHCDGDAVDGRASSVVTGSPVPSDDAVSFGMAGSRVESHKHPNLGTVTESRALVQNVQVGPLHIGVVESVAASRARGRTGTTESFHSRRWCDITVAGLPVEPGGDVPGVAKIRGCVDPDDEDDAKAQRLHALITELNQRLQRVRIEIPAVLTEATGGGYQAQVTKDPGLRAADQAVNEDDSITAPALQVIVYNDNNRGRNRLIFQFAGVESEARYGIGVIPQFDVPDLPDGIGGRPGRPPTFTDTREVRGITFFIPGMPGTPLQYITEDPGYQGIASRKPSAPRVEPPGTNFFNSPVQALKNLLRWLINNPTEFALLFALWSVLAFPVYLILRRRSFEQALLE